MISSDPPLPAPSRAGFPDDFPSRLERLRAASGLSWRALAEAAGLNLRAVHRWRAGAKPGAAHLLTLLDFAAEHDALDCLLEGAQPWDRRQAVIFDQDTWERLAGDYRPDASDDACESGGHERRAS